jgi:N-methylhydantoinase A
MSRYRITVDTGGTFSDFVYLNEDTGEISITKIASTPDDPSRAILSGIEALLDRGVRADVIRFFCHGTTVCTNALLEGKGVRTGLLVTQGFRGIYPVAEQCRPYGSAIFDVMYDKPAMLVPDSLTAEVVERVDFRGRVVRELDEKALCASLAALKAKGIESLAVCLLFSFLHPQHEARVAEIAAQEMPGCSISLSSQVLPQIREYHRLSTTVINAYLQPILARYIEQLDRRLTAAGILTRQKYVMQSNGGMATFAGAARRAASAVLSGPTGGVIAGTYACRMTGYRNVVTFDMGGTSCDVALIKDGEPSLTSRGKIDGRDLAVPMTDIHTVSAGGGTLVRADRFGGLQVGPESAGAVPGPACYGRGGTEPTITDCNLVLGMLSEDNFLGGRMRLDLAKARTAVEQRMAALLSMDRVTAAEGAIRIIDVKMEEAIKAISTMRGHDLRDFMLLAFGGAGPLHAGRIARNLGMAGIIIPRYPGVYSAIGLLMSDVKHDYVQSRLMPLDALSAEDVNAAFAGLEREAREELGTDGFAPDQLRIERAIDMRYAGQGYEVTLRCPDCQLTADRLAMMRKAFDDEHRSLFGHCAPQEQVEVVSYRLRGIGLVPPVELPRFKPTGLTLADAQRQSRDVRFDGEIIHCPTYQREGLDVGLKVGGPAILDQFDCTTVICPGQVALVDEWRNLIVTMGSP